MKVYLVNLNIKRVIVLAVTQVSEHEFMCPECGKTFDIKDAAEKHLHSVHVKHLRAAHGEFHGEDVDSIHVG